MAARYAIGIDLGTTNSVLSFVELDARTPQARIMEIPQLVDRSTVEADGSP